MYHAYGFSDSTTETHIMIVKQALTEHYSLYCIVVELCLPKRTMGMNAPTPVQTSLRLLINREYLVGYAYLGKR